MGEEIQEYKWDQENHNFWRKYGTGPRKELSGSALKGVGVNIKGEVHLYLVWRSYNTGIKKIRSRET